MAIESCWAAASGVEFGSFPSSVYGLSSLMNHVGSAVVIYSAYGHHALVQLRIPLFRHTRSVGCEVPLAEANQHGVDLSIFLV